VATASRARSVSSSCSRSREVPLEPRACGHARPVAHSATPPRRVLGNLPDLESDEVVIVRMMELAREYGPNYKLQFPQNELVIIEVWR
jgi:hypothetical protein